MGEGKENVAAVAAIIVVVVNVKEFDCEGPRSEMRASDEWDKAGRGDGH